MTSKDHPIHSSNHSGPTQVVLARATELGAEATAAVAEAATIAGRQLQTMAKRSEKLARNHPWMAAGAMFGAGAILGAIAHRFFEHRPTVSDLLVEALPGKARRAVSRHF